jgi:hypothetical protein
MLFRGKKVGKRLNSLVSKEGARLYFLTEEHPEMNAFANVGSWRFGKRSEATPSGK